MTHLSLRARYALVVAASIVVSAAALCLGASTLLAAFARASSPHAVSQAVWTMLTIVALFIPLAAIGALVVASRAIRARVATLSEEILAHSLTEPGSTLQSAGRATDPDLLAPLYHALAQLSRNSRAVVHHHEGDAARYRAIVDGIPESVICVDAGGRVLSANPSAMRLFNRTSATLHGVVLSDLLSVDSVRMQVDDLGTVSFSDTGIDARFTGPVRLFGHASFQAEITILPMVSHAPRAWAIFIHDRTAALQAESTLHEARLNAETANAAKTAFLARLSHELRTPLNSIIGFTKIVRRSRSSQLAERDSHYLDRAQVGSEHLLALVNDILDLSQIESGQSALVMQSTDIAPVVRSVFSQFEDQVTNRPVVLDADLPDGEAFATVDESRLRQVLTHLIANALKFTARGTVRVSVLLHRDTGRAAAVSVRDTGIGIPLGRQVEIFDSFEQGDDATSHRYGGTGIGLTLSRRIAQQMGCLLSVESMPGAGSTFTLTFAHSESLTAVSAPCAVSDAA